MEIRLPSPNDVSYFVLLLFTPVLLGLALYLFFIRPYEAKILALENRIKAVSNYCSNLQELEKRLHYLRQKTLDFEGLPGRRQSARACGYGDIPRLRGGRLEIFRRRGNVYELRFLSCFSVFVDWFKDFYYVCSPEDIKLDMISTRNDNGLNLGVKLVFSAGGH